MTEPRIGCLRSVLRRKSVDAILVSALSHIRYLTNFTGSNALCLIRLHGGVLYTDMRYARQSALEVRGVRCKVTTSSLIVEAARSIALMRSPRVAVEAEHLDLEQYRRLRKLSPRARIFPSRGIVEGLSEIKEDREVRSIAKAATISDKTFEHILRRIRPGVTELDIASEISFLQKRFGGEGDAFEPIVAGGRRSSLPHARATRRKIANRDIVLLDFGCVVRGYRSDITRTVVVGKASANVRRIYSAVLAARNTAVENARAGLKARDLDQIARQHLAGAGLARYFIHSLGHGLGLQVHEGPKISPLSSDILKVGNVVTLEPGVYIPSLGGIRIEDDVLITNSGCKVLSHADTELQVV